MPGPRRPGMPASEFHVQLEAEVAEYIAWRYPAVDGQCRRRRCRAGTVGRSAGVGVADIEAVEQVVDPEAQLVAVGVVADAETQVGDGIGIVDGARIVVDAGLVVALVAQIAVDEGGHRQAPQLDLVVAADIDLDLRRARKDAAGQVLYAGGGAGANRHAGAIPAAQRTVFAQARIADGGVGAVLVAGAVLPVDDAGAG